MTDVEKQAEEHSDDNEPVLRPAVVTGVVGALLSAGVTFGIDLDAKQVAAVATVAGFILPIIVGIWGRKGAFSPKTVVKIMEKLNSNSSQSEDDFILRYLNRNELKLVPAERLDMLEKNNEIYHQIRPRKAS